MSFLIIGICFMLIVLIFGCISLGLYWNWYFFVLYSFSENKSVVLAFSVSLEYGMIILLSVLRMQFSLGVIFPLPNITCFSFVISFDLHTMLMIVPLSFGVLKKMPIFVIIKKFSWFLLFFSLHVLSDFFKLSYDAIWCVFVD